MAKTKIDLGKDEQSAIAPEYLKHLITEELMSKCSSMVFDVRYTILKPEYQGNVNEILRARRDVCIAYFKAQDQTQKDTLIETFKAQNKMISDTLNIIL